jgi:hypothetical protein
VGAQGAGSCGWGWVVIPNRFDVVQRVNREHTHLIQTNSLETVTEFLWRVVWALHQEDPRWGFLSKSAGENGTDIPGVGRVAIDAIGYEGEHNSVDIVGSAGDGIDPESGETLGSIGWGEDPHRRVSNKWTKPVPYPDWPSEPGEPDQTDEYDKLGLTIGDVLRQLNTEIAGLRADVEQLKAKPTGGSVKLPKRIALKSDHGTYLTAEHDGRVTVREEHPAGWQTFELEVVE